MSAEEEWRDKHDDGHVLDITMAVGKGGSGGGYTYPQISPTILCPDESFCKRWAKERGAPDFCFIRNEIASISWLEFMEAMQVAGLPDDWSRGFPVGIEWLDRGEDGLEWWPKPVVTPLDALKELTERVEQVGREMSGYLTKYVDEDKPVPVATADGVLAVLGSLEMMAKGDPGCNDDSAVDRTIRRARGC